MHTRTGKLHSEGGAVFVQFGICLFVLMAFNVFVLDYGMMWVARREAQNAADAGALAGATAQAYDVVVTPTAALTSAQSVATANMVWQQAATPVASAICPPGVTGVTCMTVNIYRNGSNGSTALPMLFGPVIGLTSQGVQASATAVIGPANTTTCLKPWALPDRWNDVRSPANEFNAWSAGVPLSPADVYNAPSASAVGTTSTLPASYGFLVPFDVNYAFNHSITRGFMLPLVLAGKTHLESMTECYGQPISIGQKLTIDTDIMGGSGGVAESAAWAAFNLDPSADYAFEAGGYVANSCAPNCAPVSPRLWAIALYDPSDFDLRRGLNDWSGCPDAPKPCIQIKSITGFFIDYLDPAAPNGRHGHLLRYPGITVPPAPPIAAPLIEAGSWLVEPHLIR
jgi:Flp pilus assembly protein TadG